MVGYGNRQRPFYALIASPAEVEEHRLAAHRGRLQLVLELHVVDVAVKGDLVAMIDRADLVVGRLLRHQIVQVGINLLGGADVGHQEAGGVLGVGRPIVADFVVSGQEIQGLGEGFGAVERQA